uniref:Orf41 n=1 Tax=Daucus carota subsp. sativus TaxID=79200 RepID=I1TIE9_DAUCS|nr:orf41 [Daucus carota subsp. sativus]AEY81179.1 orf41 [Daucus carota subsp. sativus]
MQSKTANFIRKTPVQLMQPTKRSPTSSRQLLTRMPLGKNLHKVTKRKSSPTSSLQANGQQHRPIILLIIHILFQTILRTIRRSGIFFLLRNLRNFSAHTDFCRSFKQYCFS